MSRLTLPHYGGKGHYMKCSEQFGCSGECADCEELDKIVEKLAEYEDREEKKPQTNADRIRAMSDEELMQFLFNEVSNNTICSFCVPTMRTKCKCDGHCKNGILEWLKQPAEGSDG